MEQFQYLNKIITEFEKLIQEFGGEIKPCTQEEVEQLESLLSDSYYLPAAYKEFLLYGGKKMGDIFSGGCFFDYHTALVLLKARYRDTISTLQMYEPQAQLPPDFFLIGDRFGYYFEYVLLKEGDNPPVYAWYEEHESGLETAWKAHDSFSDFLMNEIRFNRMHLAGDAISKKLEAGQAPRGQQIWYPTHQEQERGIVFHELMRYFGFYGLGDIDEATILSGLNSELQYLEELSGWQAHQIGAEFYFFPPNTSAETIRQINRVAVEELKAVKPIRGLQNWASRPEERVEGMSKKTLMRLMGFYYLPQLENAATLCRLDSNSYLEELTGWQARQIDGEMRFFPPDA